MKPFELTDEEVHAILQWRKGHGGLALRNTIAAALSRAEGTLPPVQGSGCEWTRGDAIRLAEAYRNRWNKHEGYSSADMLEALNECFPRGKP